MAKILQAARSVRAIKRRQKRLMHPRVYFNFNDNGWETVGWSVQGRVVHLDLMYKPKTAAEIADDLRSLLQSLKNETLPEIIYEPISLPAKVEVSRISFDEFINPKEAIDGK